MNDTSKFTQGKIVGPIVAFTLPILFSLIIQSLYGSVDLLIVGRFGSAANVSGVSMGSEIVNTITYVVNSLATGITILVGQMIGKNEKKRAGDVIGSGIWLFAGIGVLLTAVVMIFAPQMLTLLNTPAEAMEQGIAYTRICAGGLLCIIAYNLLGSVFRGIGDSVTPLISVGIACVVNIAGDLLLVGVFDMAAAGAAIATVFAQLVSVIVSLIIVRRKKLPIEFSRASLKCDGTLVKNIVKLGLPLAAQEMVVAGSFLVVAGVINQLGLTASAGLGVANKLVSFINMFSLSFGQSISAFTAHNVGAGRLKRAKKGMKYCIIISLAFSCVMFYLTFFQGTVLTGLFTKDAGAMYEAADYLKAFGIDTVITSVFFCFAGYFNGCGRTGISMIQAMMGAVIRTVLVFVFFNSPVASMFTIALSTPISSVFQLLLCVIYYLATNRKLTEQLDTDKDYS